ncbi:tRNA (guanosine(37)-N1)-methyltransferase TrmD [Mycoplasmatota bacterium]|nr:tRNA (guanosine(37)-N1)-methyltransferase TrmD [Mycoplasmatota bacterium]
MRIDILTLFPELIQSVIKESIIGRAIDTKKIDINVINFRDYSNNKHNKVDDYPFGGGAGMLLGIQPIYDALQAIEKKNKTKVLLTSPQGTTFNQLKAEALSEEEHLIIICGHYEGIDDRVREYLVDEEISVGDYVLTGGELAALIIVDAVSRLIPNVLNEASHQDDSFSTRLLEYPQFTRPASFKGMNVPDVLLSGNHRLIKNYRLKESLRNTYLKRPDLLNKYSLNKEEKRLLEEIVVEESEKSKK